MERKWIHVFRSIFHWLFFLVLVFGFCNDGNKSRGKHLLAKQNDALVREITLSKHQFCVSAEILQYIPPILNTYFFYIFCCCVNIRGEKKTCNPQRNSFMHSLCRHFQQSLQSNLACTHTDTHLITRWCSHAATRQSQHARVWEKNLMKLTACHRCAYAASCRQAPHQCYWSTVWWMGYRLSPCSNGGSNPLAAGP